MLFKYPLPLTNTAIVKRAVSMSERKKSPVVPKPNQTTQSLMNSSNRLVSSSPLDELQPVVSLDYLFEFEGWKDSNSKWTRRFKRSDNERRKFLWRHFRVCQDPMLSFWKLCSLPSWNKLTLLAFKQNCSLLKLKLQYATIVHWRISYRKISNVFFRTIYKFDFMWQGSQLEIIETLTRVGRSESQR